MRRTILSAAVIPERITLTISICLMVSPWSAVSQHQWTWQNPNPQGSDIYAVCFVDADTGYTAGRGGTLNRTTDGGTTWIRCKSPTTNDLFGISFSDASHGAAVGKAGTIVRTTDGGVTWIRQPSGTSSWLRGICFATGNAGTAVGIGGLILRTVNGGTSWVPQSSGTTSHLLGVAFSDANNGLAVGYDGTILRTTDGGSVWDPRTSGTTNPLHGIGFGSTVDGMAVGAAGTMLKTTDGGITWSPLPGGTSAHLYGISFIDPDHGIVSGAGGVIRYTSNGGATWNPGSSGTIEHLYGVGMGDIDRAWAVGVAGTLLSSSSGGQSWTSQLTGTTVKLNGVSFSDADHGLAAGDFGAILRTIDGGESWQDQESGTSHHLRRVSMLDSNVAVAVGDFGTILRTTDGGSSWVPESSHTTGHLYGLDFPGTNLGFATGEELTILRTADGGMTWTVQYTLGDPYGPMWDVDFFNQDFGAGVGDGNIFLTRTSGVGWADQTGYPFLPTVWWSVVSHPDTNVVIIAADGGSMARTTDAGSSWHELASGTDRNLKGQFFSDPLRGITVGGGGIILCTTDGGSTWTREDGGVDTSLNEVVFIDDSTGWAVGDRGTIIRTGRPSPDSIHHFEVQEKWNMVSVPYRVSDYSKTALFPSAITGAFTFDDGYIPRETLTTGEGYWLKFPSAGTISMAGDPLDAETVDVSAGWNMLGSLSTPVYAADIGSIPGGLVTSGFYEFDGSYLESPVIIPGKGYWVKAAGDGKLVLSVGGAVAAAARIRIDDHGESPPAPPESERKPGMATAGEFRLFQNRPNPFNPTTRISFILPAPGHVSLRVYDLLGRAVGTLVDEIRPEGEHTVEWNGAAFPSGVYFYRLRAGTFDKITPMVLLR